MKYLEEFRQPQLVHKLLEEIRSRVSRPWAIMEVCGGQTHSIMRYGIDQLLPPSIELIHGPGCPVCVTPLERIDQALTLAARPEVTFCTFGDMLRVPGSHTDLFHVKSQGGDVRMVYSPLDALALARQLPQRQVIFFAVGFETTAPANAMAVLQARRLGLKNFSVLVSHVLVPPALEAVLASPQCRVQGFLAAGHVCSVMGWQAYRQLSQKHSIPIVVTGFEPLDLLEGVRRLVIQLEEGRWEAENAYERAVRLEGNRAALGVLEEVFEVTDRTWRGIGSIPQSGWRLRAEFAEFDAQIRFPYQGQPAVEPEQCQSGRVLQGLLKPDQCPAFGRSCTPRTPLGATMVSSEGACAAYYRHRHSPC
jgi:hydrogenase expression/formation protein HypD